jgi:hypothetical protein
MLNRPSGARFLLSLPTAPPPTGVSDSTSLSLLQLVYSGLPPQLSIIYSIFYLLSYPDGGTTHFAETLMNMYQTTWHHSSRQYSLIRLMYEGGLISLWLYKETNKLWD